MAENVCSDCIEDSFLAELLKEEGTPELCDECGKTQPHTISIERLGELLAPIIQEHYEPGGDTPRFYDASDNPSWEQSGDDLDFVVQEVLGQYFDFNEEIRDAVIASEHCDVRHGEMPFFDSDTNYEAKPTWTYEYQQAWDLAVLELGSTRRFFSSSVKRLFDDLFQDVDKLLTSDAPANEKPRVVAMMAGGTSLFRGRMCDSTQSAMRMLKKPYKEVGPPPPNSARAGRMNAEGIPVFYGSLDSDTCLAELRPALGTEAAIITVKTNRNLRLLDFTRLRSTYRALSYFQPDFSEQASRFAFLRKLARLISRPIIPGHESEYLITQTMMEYLAHVHEKPFDGVLFASAQKEGGTNIVLFSISSGSKVKFPIEYEQDSLKFLKTTGIAYEHKSIRYRLEDDGVVKDYDYSEDD